MEAFAPARGAALVVVSERELTECIARTPIDHHLIWNGRMRVGRPNSILTCALSFIDEVWRPVPLRAVLLRAARVSGEYGMRPEAVKKAVWGHQAAAGACYFLVRATSSGDYLAVTDVPRPASWPRPIVAGDVVMGCKTRLDWAEPNASPLTRSG